MIKIVLIDNNDSFTFNIVELLRKFYNCKISVINSGGLNINQLKKFDKIIISPGPGLPEEFPILKEILKNYYKEKPMLGICLGHEAIGQYFGAKLRLLKSVVHGQPRQMKIVFDSTLYKNIPKKFSVGLYHSWVLKKENFPSELLISGLSQDGNIMSIQHKQYKLFGVQFHPESIISEYGKEIFENFINV